MTFALTPQANVVNGRVRTTDANESSYGTLVENYGEGDFTLELSFSVSTIKGRACVLLAHWHTQTRAHAENFISIAVLPNKHLQVLMANSPEDLDWVAAVTAQPIALDTDYTLVLERVGAEVCVYLNGALVTFFHYKGPTFFKDHTLLGYHTGEVTGGSRQVWGLRIARNSVYKGNIPQSRAFPEELVVAEAGYDPTLWLQYSFADNEAINEVTETFASLANNATIANRALVTGATASDNMQSSPVLFDANEDFTVELMFNCSTYNVNMPLLGVTGGSGTGVSKNAWYLFYQPALGAFRFLIYDSASEEHATFIRADIRGVDTHIAAARYKGVLTLYINGTPVASTPSTKGNVPTSLSMNTSFTNTYFSGARKNIRITKGKAQYATAFTPPTELAVVGRPTYDQETSDAIRVQMDLRRDNAINEANRLGVQMYGTAKVVQSAVVQTAATSSYYSTLMEPFGAGDFTVELEFNLSSINATYGTVLAGQWHYGQQTNRNNCWYLHCASNRLLTFGISKSAAASDYTGVSSASNAFALNTDNKLVIERIAGEVTMYMNGIQIAQGVHPQPIRKVEPCFVRSLSAANLYAHAGKIWNLRIADKAMYNGVITHEPQFPKLRPRPVYDQATLDDIVCQCSLRNGNARNEKTGQNITTSGTGEVMLDGITTTLVNTSRFYIPTPNFGAANFTIELKLTMLSSTGASTRPIFGQHNGNATGNSWVLYTTATNNLAFQGNPLAPPATHLDSAAASVFWQAGVEYHVVIERVGTTVSMYIDGQLVDSGELVGPMKTVADPRITNLYDTSTAKFCASKIRDVRIAKRALFNGNVQRQPLPEVPYQKPSLILHSNSNPALHGAMQNLDYFGLVSSAGTFSHTLFRDIRDPENVKTVRLVALVHDRSYTVLAYKPSDIPPTPDMPVFTNSLKIGESTVLLSAASSAATRAGAIGLYWNGNLLGTNTQGKCVPFEFI